MGYRDRAEPSLVDIDQPDGPHRRDRESESADLEDARLFARIGYYAVPVAMIHVGILYTVLSGVFHLELPRLTTNNPFFVWLWVNGAAVAVGIWFWRSGRIPLRRGLWIRGRTARLFILSWLGLSVIWFVAPTMLRRLLKLLPAAGW